MSEWVIMKKKHEWKIRRSLNTTKHIYCSLLSFKSWDMAKERARERESGERVEWERKSSCREMAYR